MRAAVLHEAGGALRIESIPRPAPGPGEVLVRVRACGLGLTLVWNRNGRRAARLPRVMGHEIAGDIVEVGSGAGELRPGDRVAVYYYLTCGACRWCVRGREDVCERRAGQVGREIDGGLAEFVRLPVGNVCVLPSGVSYVDAAIASDAVATALHVMTARASVEAGETVLVMGAGGGVGVHMVQVARLLGAHVIGVDISAEKLALAEVAGAADALDARRPDFDEALRRLSGDLGFDVVVDMVGTRETLRRSAASLGTGGRLVLVGSSDRDAVLPLSHDTLRGEASILGSQYCTRAELAEALLLVAAGRLRPIVTRRCSLEEADAVLRAVERMEVAGRACVIFPGGSRPIPSSAGEP